MFDMTQLREAGMGGGGVNRSQMALQLSYELLLGKYQLMRSTVLNLFGPHVEMRHI